MASKKSTTKLKKTKNKNSEHEDLETSSAQKDISTENEAKVVDEIARRAGPTAENHHSSATSAPDAPLPRIPEKAKDVDKKKSKFWSFVKRKKMFLPRCSEVKEEPDEEGETQTDRKPRCTGHNIAGILYRASLHSSDASASPVPTSASQARRLSMGAGSGPTGLSATISPVRMQLLQLVPPANSTLLDLPEFAQGTCSRDEANDMMLCQQMRATDMGVMISSNPIGYPHLCFSRSMSNSSSGSSSSSGASSVTDHSVTHGLVSTIYPQIDVIVPNARFHGPLLHPLTTNTSTFLPKLPGSEQVIDNSQLGAVSNCSNLSHTVHTQVDYVHYLVPDLLQLTNCSFYWGVMDRYEAERLLENRPEGTFLVRDSAQEEFLFSVSFRRYGRSLHARIEQLNHRFSFDSHDLGVFASDTVCGLIEHYKDPNCCMFFEPMLTLPLCRTFCFTLQHLCRAVICSHVTYDSINELQLPKCLHEYLKYYHYKLRICVRKLETH